MGLVRPVTSLLRILAAGPGCPAEREPLAPPLSAACRAVICHGNPTDGDCGGLFEVPSEEYSLLAPGRYPEVLLMPILFKITIYLLKIFYRLIINLTKNNHKFRKIYQQ